ncbi:MAG TPA: choice-of-anchor Q domain-containing protein [Verrucomicrobiae bacterium]|nr:choice-of-anchor Q domain-containing protein [Verrucomicrobiae bacterium]
MTANSASYGGGVYDCTADNCILYYNTGGDWFNDDPRMTINDCCMPQIVTNGFRNITNAPLFANAAANDFHLQANSPCINSGQNLYITSVSSDFGGNARIVGGTVDIGAYEYQTPASMISYAYLQHYGLPADGSVDYSDLDGTGFNVYQDWVAGLNPTNPASILAMETVNATNNTGGITVSWHSVGGIPYNLQRATNLTVYPPFTTIQSNIAGQPGTTSYQDVTATNGGPYFYRVNVIAP